jgi:pectate lyase
MNIKTQLMNRFVDLPRWMAVCLAGLSGMVLSGVILVGVDHFRGEDAAIAQESNFGKLTLTAVKTTGSLKGTTGGSTSLPAIIGSADSSNRKCLGFADPKPDHILILRQDFANLSLRVNGGTETTLVVRGTDGTVRCGDTQIVDTSWRAGTYYVWVGTITPATRRDYTLIAQP